MDFIVTSHRSKPFVDGKTYPRICFACFHVPVEYITSYDEEGNIEVVDGPFYSHRYINTAEDLFANGSASTLQEARTSVDAVKRLCRSIGCRELDKLKLHRPTPEYELNPEHQRKKIETYRKRNQKNRPEKE